MSDNSTPIQVGSIIHLENGFPHGGYLDMRGWVTDKPVIKHFYDPHVLAIVSTHEGANRSMGSGSWEILSAHGKPVGEPLMVGDEIHLRNMYSGAGYLDTFEWVWNLEPFKDYPIETGIGVFTSSDPRRGGGLSGTWTIRSAGDKQDGDKLFEGDAIFLENNYKHPSLKEGFLRTYGNVTAHEMFKEYDGQRGFVFIGPAPNPEEGSRRWTVTLSSPPENLYYIWGNEAGKWLDFGAFKISGLLQQALIALKISSVNEGRRLVGKVAYSGEGYVDVEAEWIEQNSYKVIHRLNGAFSERHPNGTWILGGRDDKKIIHIDITSADNGRTVRGTISYTGEPSINLKGIRATTTLFNEKQRTLLYDFFEPALWTARIRRISDALETAVNELDEVLFTIAGFSIERLADLLNDAGGNSYAYLAKEYISQVKNDKKENDYERRFWQLLQHGGSVKAFFDQSQEALQNPDFTINPAFNHLNEKLLDLLARTPLPLSEEKSPDAIDFEYQVKQLLNIYTLWRNMDEFWELLSDTSITTIKKLSDAQILPPVHRIRDCFHQFTIDFEIIQSAIQQRRWVQVLPERELGNFQAGSLVITDKLAAMALAPFQHLLSDSSHIIPITYFTKTIHIRQLPYTDQFVLVGLTYDLTSSVGSSLPGGELNNQEDTPIFELMAIPHEVGHFLYHHARLVKDKTVTTFADMNRQFKDHPYHRWCEEIFADLYGCMIAGTFTVLGLQALLAAGDKDRVLLDDEDHPTPILRPYFLSEMLRILSSQEPDQYDFSEVAMILDANWTAILERWGFVPEGVVNGRPARIRLPGTAAEHLESSINIEKTLKNVQPIIAAFADALLTNAEFAPWAAHRDDDLSATIPWCGKHQSLNKYIQEIKDLIGQKIAGKKVPHLNLSKEYKLKRSMRQQITSMGGETNEFVGSILFENILDGWRDSGPHGFGAH